MLWKRLFVFVVAVSLGLSGCASTDVPVNIERQEATLAIIPIGNSYGAKAWFYPDILDANELRVRDACGVPDPDNPAVLAPFIIPLAIAAAGFVIDKAIAAATKALKKEIERYVASKTAWVEFAAYAKIPDDKSTLDLAFKCLRITQQKGTTVAVDLILQAVLVNGAGQTYDEWQEFSETNAAGRDVGLSLLPAVIWQPAAMKVRPIRLYAAPTDVAMPMAQTSDHTLNVGLSLLLRPKSPGPLGGQPVAPIFSGSVAEALEATVAPDKPFYKSYLGKKWHEQKAIPLIPWATNARTDAPDGLIEVEATLVEMGAPPRVLEALYELLDSKGDDIADLLKSVAKKRLEKIDGE